MTLAEIMNAWRNGLIVSCQAPADSPLACPEIIAALALCAEHNGAVGVRIDRPENIGLVRSTVTVPIIGIEKKIIPGCEVYITPTYESASAVIASGADVVALDATARPRPNGETFRSIVDRIKSEYGTPVMADVATYEEGMAAEAAGADFVGTTLAGYTAETAGLAGPDFNLVERLARQLSVPVICEGRLRQPADVRRAFAAGAFVVVVGNAITGVDALVREFVRATPMGASDGF